MPLSDSLISSELLTSTLRFYADLISKMAIPAPQLPSPFPENALILYEIPEIEMVFESLPALTNLA